MIAKHMAKSSFVTFSRAEVYVSILRFSLAESSAARRRLVAQQLILGKRPTMLTRRFSESQRR
eukprot:1363266-Amorphochlora_amoeboformis.AAC.2